MNIPKFNYRVNQTILERGIEYFQSGKVNSVYRLSEEMYMASISGEKQYEVYVIFKNGQIEDSVCTCPCKYVCKHVVAVSMYILKNENKIIQIKKYNTEDVEKSIEVVNNFNASKDTEHRGSAEKYFIRGELAYEQINFKNISKELKLKVNNSFNDARSY